MSEEGSAALRVQLLGGFTACIEGRPLPAVHSRKVYHVLAYLLVHADQPVSRKSLANAIVPHAPDPSAYANLKQYLGHLRKALGPQGDRLSSSRKNNTVCFNTGGAIIDVVEFDQAIASHTVPALRLAVELYEGPFLAGWTALDRSARSPQGHVDWILQKREHYHAHYVSALRTLFAHHLQEGALQSVLPYLRLLEAAGAGEPADWARLLHAAQAQHDSPLCSLIRTEIETRRAQSGASAQKLLIGSKRVSASLDRDNIWTMLSRAFKESLPPTLLGESVLRHWIATGLAATACERLVAFLDQRKAVSSVADPYVRSAIVRLAIALNDLDKAEEYGQQAYTRFRDQGELHGLTGLLSLLAHAACNRQDYPTYLQLLNERLELQRSLGDPQEEQAQTLISLGDACYQLGEYQSARSHHEEALRLLQSLQGRSVHIQRSVALTHACLGFDAMGEAHFREARQKLEEAVAAARALKASDMTAYLLVDLGRLGLRTGEWDLTRSAFLESLMLYGALKDHFRTEKGLEWLLLLEHAHLKQAQEREMPAATIIAWGERLAQLWGMVQALRARQRKTALSRFDASELGAAVSAATTVLGSAAFTLSHQQGYLVWSPEITIAWKEATAQTLHRYGRPLSETPGDPAAQDISGAGKRS